MDNERGKLDALLKELSDNETEIERLTSRNEQIQAVCQQIDLLLSPTRVSPTPKLEVKRKPALVPKPKTKYKPRTGLRIKPNGWTAKVLEVMADGKIRGTRDIVIDAGAEPTPATINTASAAVSYLIEHGKMVKMAHRQYRLKYAPLPKGEPKRIIPRGQPPTKEAQVLRIFADGKARTSEEVSREVFKSTEQRDRSIAAAMLANLTNKNLLVRITGSLPLRFRLKNVIESHPHITEAQ